ncbi:hypothetical protein [Sanguibacter sp. HDW7]|uniref:hypothetical protein n=1 Tax=Sanguibacter sp. HDW7 TaxID=2714931 RepID=UPI001407594D|nr:hypothetical protein [Sanguibacter sp. HDW7]QIK82994.1 hypothetical protein G7063_04645 [Sanguibacter sp. HDW7]
MNDAQEKALVAAVVTLGQSAAKSAAPHAEHFATAAARVAEAHAWLSNPSQSH